MSNRIPTVAIVGRPNVGKSSLFNVLSDSVKSIVDDTAGVTRDRIIANCDWNDFSFDIVDTGGVDFNESNIFAEHIKEQVDIAVDIADVIIFVVDGRVGIQADDEKIVRRLRESKKPIVLAVNKIDNNNLDTSEFYKLAIGPPYPISTVQRNGVADMLDKVVSLFNTIKFARNEGAAKRIAIVGKPNAGKSSIVNCLLGEKRVMVSEIAGTTRDTVDSELTYYGQKFIITDTAGIRRKRSVEIESVEHYSVLRALNAIKNSDVVVLVIDAEQGITEQDVRLAGIIHESFRPSVIAVNKVDLARIDEKQLHADLAFMNYFKAVNISALTGKKIGDIMSSVIKVMENAERRITTGLLNEIVLNTTAVQPPPFRLGVKPKFLYSTQVAVSPPTFALFVNRPDCVDKTYLRYIENTIRKSVDFSGTPIKIVLRGRKEEG
ncbi:MAG: ribosome biogenesis GTPase Der [Christensenellaceae bacterium]|jgi:GTP-binding protein|nr:ribosome biogenesis GTPase Der [Christensenellaceae bacterium]